jgi:hypothetical protein
MTPLYRLARAAGAARSAISAGRARLPLALHESHGLPSTAPHQFHKPAGRANTGWCGGQRRASASLQRLAETASASRHRVAAQGPEPSASRTRCDRVVARRNPLSKQANTDLLRLHLKHPVRREAGQSLAAEV